MIGGTLGSYRLLSELGRGGMGAVFLAEHTLIGKRAAAKILLPQFSRDPEIVERFFNEARAATQIRHAGIVEVFDFGYSENGSAYLVMEFLDGESLATRLAREGGQLSEAWLVEIARQLASALRAAHDKSIVHRDLKPDNAFLVPDPELAMGVRVKLLDFGIAKLSGDADRSVKTRTGAVMGTPSYMSPEQCRGAGAVDARSDVYSLGCMMFEMACGHPPYVGEGPGDVIGAHIFSEIPHASGASPMLDALITRMLQKTPAGRPQSMSEVLTELQSLSRTSGRQQAIAPTPAGSDARTLSMQPSSTTLGGAASEMREAPRTPSRSPAVWITPLVLLLGGGSFAWYWTQARPPAPTEVRAAAAPTEEAAAPEEAAPAEAAPAAAKRVSLSLDSQPSGAEVFRAADGVRRGKTPLVEEVERGSGETVYVFKLHGYRDARVTVPLNHDLNKVVALEKSAPKPAAAAKPPAPAAKPVQPAKRVKNAVIDPFEN